MTGAQQVSRNFTK